MSPAFRTARWLVVAGVLPPLSIILIWACSFTPGCEPFGGLRDYFLTPLYLAALLAVPAVTPPLLIAWWKRRGRSARAASVGVIAASLLVVCWGAAYLIHEVSKPHVSLMEASKPAWLELPIFSWVGHPMVAWFAAAVMVVSFVGLWVSRRALAGESSRCGYDRRGLAAEAKCPECGAVPVPAAE